MTQDEFIQKLRHELGNFPKQAVDEIIADYREYFSDALAAGRSEAEVVAALGDPVKLARELKAQATFRQWETRRSFGNLVRVVMSIAGLGLLQLLLLIPFMLYLFILTIGYVASAGLMVAGLVTVVALGSHHLFGWPSFDSLPFSFSSGSSHASQPAGSVSVEKNAAQQAKGKDSKDSDDEDDDDADNSNDSKTDAHLFISNLKDFKVVGDRFVLQVHSGARISVVTRVGPLELKNDDGKLKVNSVGGASSLFTVEPNGAWSIARADVIALNMKNDEDDERVSVARVGSDPKSFAWSLSDGDDHVSFVEGGSDGKAHLSLKSGSDSVVIDNDRVAIKSDDDNVIIVGPHGSGIGAMVYGFAMLVAGVVGLWLCMWLTRITWRGLVRYVRRQLDLITARLDEGQST
ncbi:DUF1700 domain-containing protein [Paraburkholderia megapolitana]|uniref:Uncharacterized membrane protein n=1 Tax=Paraburkholderia megapolitana TaxID=420953 RepID=A0A1I3DS11_9BURK|nr:DUF1700 domain-containing protein [Paraburkholderia megapolitana]QDQ79731.1 DUF1700 domain-containing protein [Paraburkholderia megapolitana]SFH89271.1 Uncharacterized membrane protein [Paraburkholderia megapolitana]